MNLPAGLKMSVPPQIHAPRNTASLHWAIFIALIPLALFEIWASGFQALWVIGAALISAAGFDHFLARRFGRSGFDDGHGMLIGLILALLLPPAGPWYLPVFAALSMVGFKWLFGSYQSYPMHPVLFGWGFARLNWPGAMDAAWYRTPDGFHQSGEPFGVLRHHAGGGEGPFQILASNQSLPNPADSGLTDFLNDHFFSLLGARLPAGYLDPLAGAAPTVIGAGAGLAILLVSVYLFGRKLVAWQGPAGMFISFSVMIYLLGGLPFNLGLLKGDVLFFVTRGSFLFALMILASDFTSLPFSRRGRWLYGLSAGFLAALAGLASLSSDAPLLALMVCNILVYSFNKTSRYRQPGRRG